jgi:hypothetical protein
MKRHASTSSSTLLPSSITSATTTKPIQSETIPVAASISNKMNSNNIINSNNTNSNIHRTNAGSTYRSYQAGASFRPTTATSSTAMNAKNFDYDHHVVPNGYQPPIHYAADQTSTLEETTSAYYAAERTAGEVLGQLTSQRSQLHHANDDVWQLRESTEKAKRELESLRIKYRQKKQKLYMMIALLSTVDMILFFRILQCHGNFFC